MAIHEHMGVGIETFKYQHDVFLAECRSWNVELSAVLPVTVADPLQLGFIRTVEGVGDQLLAQQIQVHIPRNHGRSPLCKVLGYIAGGSGKLAKLPALTEVHVLHLRWDTPHRACQPADQREQHCIANDRHTRVHLSESVRRGDGCCGAYFLWPGCRLIHARKWL
jgi:hypothetical protein